MPLHLEAIATSAEEAPLVVSILEQMEQHSDYSLTSPDLQYFHFAHLLHDTKSGEEIGKIVFTLKAEETSKQLALLDADIVFYSHHPTQLFFVERLPQSSDANEYYEVSTVDEEQHLEIETVNRHTVGADILGTLCTVSVCAFPFNLTVFDDMDAFNSFAGFPKGTNGENTNFTTHGYAENFIAPGNALHIENCENYSFLIGRVQSFRDVTVRLGKHKLNFVIAQLTTALGILPCAMSRKVFDLKKLAIDKIIAMKADIKADFCR